VNYIYAENYQAYAEDSDERELFMNKNYCQKRHKKWPRSSGKGIDQREISPLVSSCHEPEIKKVQKAGSSQAFPAQRGNGRLRPEIEEHGKIKDQCNQHEPPDEHNLPLAFFKQKVPACMQKSG